jgi:hypothetical protein
MLVVHRSARPGVRVALPGCAGFASGSISGKSPVRSVKLSEDTQKSCSYLSAEFRWGLSGPSSLLKLTLMIPSIPPVYANFVLKTLLALGAGLTIAALL